MAKKKKKAQKKENENQPKKTINAGEAVAEVKDAIQEEPDRVNHIVINDASPENAKWYVVHSYSGHENKVATTLKQRVESLGLTDKIYEILIPTQNKIQVKKGKKETLKEKIFPSYILIKMILADDSWFAVRTTQGITGFVGTGNKPTPLSNAEVDTIKKFSAQKAPKYKASFSVGEAVKINEGPFNEFLGTVDNIDETKGRLRILVSIFGRETPVELDFTQVSKI